MKKGVIILMFLSLVFPGFQTVSSGGPEVPSEKFIAEKNGQRGAEDVYVLARTVFNAIKMNDFDMLSTYIPNDMEIEYLKNHSGEKDRYLFEEMSSDDLKANTHLNFDKVVREGMEKGINWSEAEIQESRTTMCRVGDQKMCEAMMNLQDLQGNNLKISFDMIQIKDRWFLFQGVRIKNEKASVK